MSTEPEQLKDCPFCGGELVHVSQGRTATNLPWFYVECAECGGMGPGYDEDGQTQCVEAWNERAGGWRKPEDEMPQHGQDVWLMRHGADEPWRVEWLSLFGRSLVGLYWMPVEFPPLPEEESDATDHT